ncbi:MAG: fumarylacetoacetase [Acidobacteriota bacterium]|jgi:fumarylacetoacetase|nr:fumarylacetoacetase [Acidobacteriota bacterium]
MAVTMTTDFPITNLPFGVFRRDGAPHICTAYENQIVDLHAATVAGLLDEPALLEPVLNALMAKGRAAGRAVRERVQELLRRGLADPFLLPMDGAAMLLPISIGDYTDFYASVHHATNVGSMFRPDNPLLPNYKWMPIGYHGRASSIVVSGTPVVRPKGQTRDDAEQPPVFGPSRRLDYEMEVGFVIGTANPLGEPVPASEALEHVFGFCLVNDWSARDIQTWEYQPLGPFLAKNFATTMSPWIVTLDALEPFRMQAAPRPEGDPEPLPHLLDDIAFDIQVEVWLRTAKMTEPVRLSRGNFRDMYWTVGQMVAHHTSNGCNLTPGDLLASGTVSGPEKNQRGCLLELAWRGTEPVTLPTGETRRFLEDGDEVILRAFCEHEDHPRIGFGECRGVVLPAR